MARLVPNRSYSIIARRTSFIIIICMLRNPECLGDGSALAWSSREIPSSSRGSLRLALVLAAAKAARHDKSNTINNRLDDCLEPWAPATDPKQSRQARDSRLMSARRRRRYGRLAAGETLVGRCWLAEELVATSRPLWLAELARDERAHLPKTRGRQLIIHS